MDPDHFERLTSAFVEDLSLGIASGTCLELDDDGAWQPYPVALGHVRGAVRAYRRECLETGAAARGARRLGRDRRLEGAAQRVDDEDAAGACLLPSPPCRSSGRSPRRAMAHAGRCGMVHGLPVLVHSPAEHPPSTARRRGPCDDHRLPRRGRCGASRDITTPMYARMSDDSSDSATSLVGPAWGDGRRTRVRLPHPR